MHDIKRLKMLNTIMSSKYILTVTRIGQITFDMYHVVIKRTIVAVNSIIATYIHHTVTRIN